MPNRPSRFYPKQGASSKHHSGSLCGGDHSGFPKALYDVPEALFHDYRGQGSVFSGILFLGEFDLAPCFEARNDTLWKLNDPNFDGWKVPGANLAGTGHKMKGCEFLLEMGQYAHDFCPFKVTDIQPILRDFKDKPSSHQNKVGDNFDVNFPHGIAPPGDKGLWTIPQIRAGDSVKIMAVKYVDCLGQEAMERLFVHVEAVTNTGIVVGQMANCMESPYLLMKSFPNDPTVDEQYKVHAGQLVSFPVTCVYGVKHGANWD